jgi:hypothetical protein
MRPDIDALAAQGYDRKKLEQGHAPAHSAEGKRCAQCGALAWRTEALPFCLVHSQDTLAGKEGRQ